MLFNTIEFGIFYILVFILYWLFCSKKQWSRSLFLVVVSYIFYAWWDWRFVFLILFSSLVDYSIGKLLYQQTDPKKQKAFLLLSLGVNLGVLGFFKYFNFFIDSLMVVTEKAGLQLHVSTLEILLPVGISFYTLQSLSYTIDIYRGN